MVVILCFKRIEWEEKRKLLENSIELLRLFFNF